MVKAYVGGILLALLALGYVTSAAQELPNHDNPEQLVEDALDENGYDQLEAMEDTAPLSTADDKIEQLEDVLSKQEEEEEQPACSIVFHGSFIALRSFCSVFTCFYLGCARRRDNFFACRTAICPGFDIEGAEWTRCSGEVFRIYRRSGPGEVRVGDEVGIYYLAEFGRWFGCPHARCGKSTCPGYPNSEFGFYSSRKWTECRGDVFRIYARGKDLGTPIVSHDFVFLYNPNAESWLAMDEGYPDLQNCPGNSTFPPSIGKYDQCGKESFELITRW